jgi:DNA-binding response OmpR family regulator
VRFATGRMAPVIAVSDQPSLENTLALFDCGVDDVVRKPVHPREILARAAAIRRRLKAISSHTDIGGSAFSRMVAIRKSTAKCLHFRVASAASSNI